ncbi:MAG: TIR domain-containing protein [Pseudomonadota bacterium]
MTSGKIFINYRREDAKPWSLLLYKALAPTFGPERIFYDVDTIPAGADFVAFLNAQVAEADVLLALIGDKWLEATNPETGRRRLDDPADFVRIEIAAALADPAVRVIPVMLDQTPIPSEAALPALLAPLSRRNAVRLTHERFDADMGGLTRALQTALTEAEQRRADATARDRRQAEARAAEEAAAARRAAREEHLAGLSPEEVAKAEEMANWQYIQAKDDPDLFRDHLARFPTGASSPWATEKLETLAWARLDAGAPDEAALDAFLSDFPTGAHAAAARARRDALRAEAAAEQEAARRLAEAETAWGAVKDSADPATLRAFAAQHPDSPHAAEAARLARALSRGGWTRRAALVGVGTVGLGGAVAAYENRRWIRAWALDSSLRTLRGHTSVVDSVAIAPDGTRALSGAGDRTLILWDLATGQALRTFKGHTNSVLSVALTPDGTRALSGSDDNTLKLWDLASGRALRTFKGHTLPVSSVAITPDGTRALSGSYDITVRVWDITG